MRPDRHLTRDGLGPHCGVNLDGDLDGDFDISKGDDTRGGGHSAAPTVAFSWAACDTKNSRPARERR